MQILELNAYYKCMIIRKYLTYKCCSQYEITNVTDRFFKNSRILNNMNDDVNLAFLLLYYANQL